MNTVDILKAARGLISDPAHYTARDGAEAADGRRCFVNDSAVVRWSAGAALAAAVWRHTSLVDGDRAARDAYLALGAPDTALSPHEWLVTYGARHTHAEVLALYDAAIARLEG